MVMTKSQANKEESIDDKLLTLPDNAGRAIVETGAVIAHCRERINLAGFVASEVYQSPGRRFLCLNL